MLHIGRRGLLQRNVRLYKSLAGCHGYKPKGTKKEPLPAKDTCAVASFFQRNGYKYANINPLVDPSSKTLPEVLGKEYAEVNDLEHLKSSYCGSIAFEVDHLDSCEERGWFYEKAEEHYETPAERKKEFLKLLIQSQTFDEFLGIKHPTLKRYSGEGCESMMVLFYELFKLSSIENVEDIILSIPHRGRSNLLVGLLQYPPSQLFHKIKGNAEFSEKYRFIGDVISHLTSSVTIEPSTTDGHPVHVSMVPNPSHLESSHPVAMGKSRGRLLTKGYGDYSCGGTENKVVCVQVHGDAAISAQGIVMESLSLAQVPHFDIGGSIHLVVNNQIGFTTPQDRASSMDHCTDIMKMIDCPIIHVNGDYPEEVAKATRIAFDYKNKFLKDVIINMHCFRYHGHNEIDEPSFTNPAMYNLIRSRPSVPNLYKSKLIEQAVTTENEVAEMHSTHKAMLNEAFTLSNQPTTAWQPFLGNWENVEQASNQSTSIWHTGFDLGKLRMIGEKSAELPDNFFLHKQLLKSFCTARVNKVKEGSAIDWATAEALAVGSLLLEGNNVRMCGQDVGRGTFNHRHFMLVDQDTEEMHIPLNHINPQQKALLEIVNSPLSEEAVLGYEYGVSVESPNHLVLWEAQFGDFFNGAQIIIDTFISSGEIKWLLQSGLVMLLPHGMDGAGPDHSSCKIERFLQLSDSSEDKVDSDDVNMQIVNPTTPAQYFHLIRRQQVRNFRKPLIVASPKLILRSPLATSPLSDLQEGTYFKPVLDDPESAVGADVIVFCSGKHFYALKTHREKLNKNNVAIVRLESLVPFPAEEIKDILKKYTNAQQFIWSQEEHRNQGAWSFINPRFTNLLNVNLSYRGRDVLGASAVGIGKRHVEEIQRLFDSVF